MDWAQDPAKLLSEACGATLKADLREGGRIQQRKGENKKSKNRGNIKSDQEKEEMLHGGVDLHSTAHGRLILLQMDIPEKCSAHGDTTRGEDKSVRRREKQL